MRRARSSRPPVRSIAVGGRSFDAASADALYRLAWQPYRTQRGDSGVRAFALLDDGIAVEFVGGAIYLYTHASTGRACIRLMHAAARAGRGLSTLISRTIRDRFAAKLA